MKGLMEKMLPSSYKVEAQVEHALCHRRLKPQAIEKYRVTSTTTTPFLHHVSPLLSFPEFSLSMISLCTVSHFT